MTLSLGPQTHIKTQQDLNALLAQAKLENKRVLVLPSVNGRVVTVQKKSNFISEFFRRLSGQVQRENRNLDEFRIHLPQQQAVHKGQQEAAKSLHASISEPKANTQEPGPKPSAAGSATPAPVQQDKQPAQAAPQSTPHTDSKQASPKDQQEAAKSLHASISEPKANTQEPGPKPSATGSATPAPVQQDKQPAQAAPQSAPHTDSKQVNPNLYKEWAQVNPPFNTGGIVKGHYVQRQLGNCCLAHAMASYFQGPVFKSREDFLSYRNVSYDAVMDPVIYDLSPAQVATMKAEELSDVTPVKHLLERFQADPSKLNHIKSNAPWTECHLRAGDFESKNKAGDDKKISAEQKAKLRADHSKMTDLQVDKAFEYLASQSDSKRFIVRSGDQSGHFQTLVYEPEKNPAKPWTILNSSKTGSQDGNQDPDIFNLPRVASGASPSALLGTSGIRGLVLGIWTQSHNPQTNIGNGGYQELLGAWQPPELAVAAKNEDDDLPPPIFAKPAQTNSAPPKTVAEQEDLPPPIFHKPQAASAAPKPSTPPAAPIPAPAAPQATQKTTTVAGVKIPILTPPRITNQPELFDWLKQINGTKEGTAYYGEVSETPEAAQNSNKDKLFNFNGIVFRGDSRPSNKINDDGKGFTGRTPLNKPENMLEAQGLAKGKGATGHSGASTAKGFYGAVPYMSIEREGFLYVIDTRAMPANERAFDIESIMRENNYGIGDVGSEVNVTYAPMNAIIGWISLPNAGRILDTNGLEHGKYIIENLDPAQVHFNPDYKIPN